MPFPTWDPEIDPSDPGGSVSYRDLVSQSVTVQAGAKVNASIMLKHATPVTLYLRLGGSVVPVAVTSTPTRFYISTTAFGTSVAFKVSTISGDYPTLALGVFGARFDLGEVAFTYHATAIPDYVLSSTGLVSFTNSPTGALTWTGDYYGTTPYQVDTPWGVDDLPYLNWTQSADVMIFARQTTYPQWLGRYADANWVMVPLNHANGPFEDVNTDTTKTVTVSAITGTGITITAAKDIFTSDDVGRFFYLETKDGGSPWEAAKAVNAGDVRVADGKYYTAGSTAITGTVRPTHDADSASDGVVTWTYQNQGFGIARISAFVDSKHVLADVKTSFNSSCVGTGSYKWAKSPWSSANGYPGVVTFHQQRLTFAGSPSKPNTFWMSRTGSYLDFGDSNPIRDDDSVTFTLLSNQVNAVNGLMSLGTLLAMTEGGTFTVGDKTPITPSNITADLQGYRGVAPLPPMGVGNAAVYVQHTGQNVRDLTYEFASNSYNGNDLNVFSAHLVNGYQLQEWCFQPSTNVIWAVRNDGTLLGCTYMRDQEVMGWHRHTTDGTYESVCCVPEGDEDAVYVSVLRGTKRYIERFASRRFSDIRDAFFVDCGLSFDGTNTTATKITVSGGTLWDHTETLNITSDAPIFAYPATTDVNDALVFMDADENVYRLTIRSVSSTTAATATLNKTLPVAYRSVARADWAWARDTFSGLDHLEGKTVSILSDGNEEDPKVVTSGAVTLSAPGVKVHIGLSYNSDLESLDLTIQGANLMDKKKLIHTVRLMVQNTRGLQAGSVFTDLSSVVPERTTYDKPAEMTTGLLEFHIDSSWDKVGRFVVRQSHPLPAEVQAFVPEVEIGGV